LRIFFGVIVLERKNYFKTFNKSLFYLKFLEVFEIKREFRLNLEN